MSSSRWPRSPSHGKCSKRFCGSSRSYGRSHHQRQHEMFYVMHSRATDRRSASKCQGKWPDQAVKHRSDGSHPPSRTWAFQPIQKTATIHVSSGFIWGIPAEYQAAKGEAVPTKAKGIASGTWRWLCTRYFAECAEYKRLDARTQHVRRQILESTYDE